MLDRKLCLDLIARTQKAGGVGAYVATFDPPTTEALRAAGCNPAEVLTSQPDTEHQAVEIVETLMRSGAVEVVILETRSQISLHLVKAGVGMGAFKKTMHAAVDASSAEQVAFIDRMLEREEPDERVRTIAREKLLEAVPRLFGPATLLREAAGLAKLNRLIHHELGHARFQVRTQPETPACTCGDCRSNGCDPDCARCHETDPELCTSCQNPNHAQCSLDAACRCCRETMHARGYDRAD